MKIGIDASRANLSERTGTEWYSYYLIQHLKKVIPSDTEVILYSKSPLVGDLGILPPHWRSVVLSWPPKFLWTQFRLSWEMVRNPVDLLFVPAHTIPIFHPQKTITTCHDIGFIRMPHLYSLKERMYHRLTMWFAVFFAKSIIAPSEFVKQEILHAYPVPSEKIHVIYHGAPEI